MGLLMVWYGGLKLMVWVLFVLFVLFLAFVKLVLLELKCGWCSCSCCCGWWWCSCLSCGFSAVGAIVALVVLPEFQVLIRPLVLCF